MKITEDHWIENVKRDVLEGGVAMNNRRFLVIHHTCGATGKSSIESMRAQGLSAHVVIDRDGTITQCRPFNKVCAHAGKSVWTDPHTGRVFSGLNSCAIGIELANAGPDSPEQDAFDWAKKQTGFFSLRAKHKHEDVVREWEGYPEAQLNACFELAKVLLKRYNLDDVVGHQEISRGRKTDPGPLFPMGKLRLVCGFPEEFPPGA